ncbi:hypothetical protein [Sulfitobacter pontiacus]|nr:hypothetical protein PM01_03470 [Sulfitobacter pontiacus 3SOLIMAR09]
MSVASVLALGLASAEEVALAVVQGRLDKVRVMVRAAVPET